MRYYKDTKFRSQFRVGDLRLKAWQRHGREQMINYFAIAEGGKTVVQTFDHCTELYENTLLLDKCSCTIQHVSVCCFTTVDLSTFPPAFAKIRPKRKKPSSITYRSQSNEYVKQVRPRQDYVDPVAFPVAPQNHPRFYRLADQDESSPL